MPRGVPKIGSSFNVEKPEMLGTIPAEQLDPIKAPVPVSYGSEVDLTELPPPWETDPAYAQDNTDARRFITVPVEWELRWINPKRLDAAGWRDWMPVMASDPHVQVKVLAMVDAGGNIRRGGPSGDILAWMPKHWVESRARLKAEFVARLTKKAVDTQEETAEAVNRATRGMVKVESMSHPTHTIGEGRTMTDN